VRPDRIAGVVLNDHQESRGTYKDHFYRRYGMGYGSMPSPGMTARTAVELTPLAAPPAAAAASALAGGYAAGLASRPSGGAWADGPTVAHTIVPVHHERPARASEPLAPTPLPSAHVTEPLDAKALEADSTPHRPRSPAVHDRRPLVVGASLTIIAMAGAVGYLATRPRAAPAAPPTVDAPVNPETAAALIRVKALEQRLQAIEAEKEAAETRAAAEARKRVEAEAAARGRKADPAVVARAEEDARLQAQAEQERRLREQQERLQAEQRAAEERLAEQRRTDEAARAAAAAATPTTVAVAVTPPTTVPPAAPAPAASTSPPVAAGAPPERGGLVNLSDPDVIGPVLERGTAPVYPAFPLRQRQEGTVQLRVLVDETGSVIDAQVVAGTRANWGFNEAALQSMKGRRYRPATREGVPVKVWIPVRVEFKLP
jgi:TonB family protein